MKCTLFLLFICYSVFIPVDLLHYKTRIPSRIGLNDQPNVKDGVFYVFLKKLLKMLIEDYPVNKLPKYCKKLGKSLDIYRDEYLAKLTEKLFDLSEYTGEEIKDELIQYQTILSDQETYPKVKTFLQVMNEIFLISDDVLFDDYVYDLRSYGRGDKLRMEEETGKIVKDVIMDRINRLEKKDRKYFRGVLRDAVKEVGRDVDDVHDFSSDYGLSYDSETSRDSSDSSSD